ncbi:hypothetical protein [Bowmanella pacifica]|uniref:Uncharacterized protein n=1 Tax=Bowmanella pacifica TaxID=502051 RepID=A0A918DHS8_9ALTE|nr:hypothetical protein [Bowmanella pacifica]GGO65949.1 hypothetical protein GCM10010982_09000 [Bowmanella pacifica]
MVLAFWAMSGVAEEQQNPPVDNPWLDDLQLNVSDSIDATAMWFDEFFADETMPLNEKAHGEARIRLGWEPRSRAVNEFETRFRVRVSLPNMKHQTDLIFSDYDEDEDAASVKAARNDAIDRRNRFSMALRWTAKKSGDMNISHRIGVGRKLQPYVKSRIRKTFGLSDINNVNLEASVYYYTQDRFGSHLMAQYEHQLAGNDLFRFDNHFYFRDETDDWIWQHGWYKYSQWDEKTAMIYGLYLEGGTRPNYRIEEYLVSTRWRKNALRKWLFFEVEPFLLWRRDEDFKVSYGLALRVEGYFGHSS